MSSSWHALGKIESISTIVNKDSLEFRSLLKKRSGKGRCGEVEGTLVFYNGNTCTLIQKAQIQSSNILSTTPRG